MKRRRFRLYIGSILETHLHVKVLAEASNATSFTLQCDDPNMPEILGALRGCCNQSHCQALCIGWGFAQPRAVLIAVLIDMCFGALPNLAEHFTLGAPAVL